jgi:serine protease Do
METKHRSLKTLSFVAYLLVFIALPLQAIVASQALAASTDQAPPSFADLADKVKHSVVNISTTKVIKGHAVNPFSDPDSPFREFFGDEFFKRFFGDKPKGTMKTSSLGSGVVINSDGTILTNNHVVEKADEIKIKLDDGKEYDAKILGRDPKTDLALIQAKPDKDFPQPARLGDSDAIRIGDWIMAVGNPFGLGHTVTVGIISAKGRVIGAGPYDDFLQTDAAINPGNSGGPLFNMNGEVVGINTAIVAQGQGIGFAIPINLGKELLPQLKTGKVIRGWLGVMIQNITPEMAESFNLKDTEGALVGDVLEDTPAEKAGIKRGDVIVKVDDKKIENAAMLSRLVASIAPETKVIMTVIRDGKEKNIEVEIGTMPGGETTEEQAKTESAWGITAQNVTPEMARKFEWDEGEKGVIITEVEPDSPAEEGKLKPGDLIKEINRRKIQNLRDYKETMGKVTKEESLLLLIKRGKNTFYTVLKSEGTE